jgi:protein TonB
MNLNAFSRAAGLPVALAISVLAHAALLRFMPFQIQNRPPAREAYLVTFEYKAQESPESAHPALEEAPLSEEPPLPEETPIREEPPIFQALPQRETPKQEPQSEIELEPVRQEPERLGPLLEAAGSETVEPEGEEVALGKTTQAMEVSPPEQVRRPPARLSNEPAKEAAAYDAAVNDELNRRIEKKKVYPPGARRQGIQGTVLCNLEVGASGALVGIEVAKSSGSKILDGAAVDLLKKVFPIDNPTGKPITLEKAIRYSLVE